MDPKYQRAGLGSKMIARLRQDLRKRNVIGVYLFTSSKNWAADFYVKNKFKPDKSMQMMKAAIE
jgi:GNAT superfamily N-acetyltransferase